MKKLIIYIALGIQLLVNINIATAQDSKSEPDLSNAELYSKLLIILKNSSSFKDFKTNREQVYSQLGAMNQRVLNGQIKKQDYDSLQIQYQALDGVYNNLIKKMQEDLNGLTQAGMSGRQAKNKIIDWAKNLDLKYNIYFETGNNILENRLKPTCYNVNVYNQGKIAPILAAAIPYLIELGPIFFQFLKDKIDKNKSDNYLEYANIIIQFTTKEMLKNIELKKWSEIVQPFKEYKEADSLNPDADVTPAGVPVAPESDSIPEIGSYKPIANSENIPPTQSFMKGFEENKEEWDKKTNLKEWEIKNGYLNIYKNNQYFAAYKYPAAPYQIETKLIINATDEKGDLRASQLFMWQVVYAPNGNYDGSFLGVKQKGTSNYLILGRIYTITNDSGKIKSKIEMKSEVALPDNFNPALLHTVSIDCDGEKNAVAIDGKAISSMISENLEAGTDKLYFGFRNNLREVKNNTTHSVNPVIVDYIRINKVEANQKSAAVDKGAARKIKFRYLCIGINDYAEKELQLSFAVNDAQAVHEMFNSMGEVNKKIVLLKNEEASKANILSNIDALISDCGPNDVFYFYFSGHGLPEALIPYDYTSENESSSLKYQELMNILQRRRIKLKMFLIDACHSGSISTVINNGAKSATQNYYAYLNNISQSPDNQVAAISSCYSSQVSFEYKNLSHGTYTYWLLVGCYKGYADINKDGLITAKELYRYLRCKVTGQDIQRCGNLFWNTPVYFTDY